jgi:16S rRNA (adenine1518-N6/adenine1519-N6)-dimethyltransferase
MAKKSLGQNFLKSKKAIQTMVGVSTIHADDIVLEIGPGKGALTEALIPLSGKVIAFEKDTELIPILQEKFADASNFELYEQDILEFNPENLRIYKQGYKLVANIPYYITGAIIRHFLETSFQPKSMTLLVQKEVAERIIARDGKESILSLSVKAYGIPNIVMKVSKQYFSPAPKVDSAIIHIGSISKDFFKNFNEKDFFRVVKTAFQFKRKNICNNLKDTFSNTREVLEELDISEKTRAEDLNLQMFALLTQKLK